MGWFNLILFVTNGALSVFEVREGEKNANEPMVWLGVSTAALAGGCLVNALHIFFG